MPNYSKKFNVLDHLDQLNILKEQGSQYVCQCPVCGKRRFTISKENGAYQCWSGGCSPQGIREAIAPRSEISWKSNKSENYVHKATIKSELKSCITKVFTLAKLSGPVTDTPQHSKKMDNQYREILETIYQYSPSQWVVRIQWQDSSKPKGYSKKFRQCHTACEGEQVPVYKDGAIIEHRTAKVGETVFNKGNIPWKPYRWDEAIMAAQNSCADYILVPEGEECVESLRKAGLSCSAFKGGIL